VKFTNVPEGSDRKPERVLWNTRRTWRVDLKNHTPDDLVIRLVEVATGQWSLAGEIQPTEVKNGNVFHIDVPVAAGEEKTIEYTIIQENVEPGDAVLP